MDYLDYLQEYDYDELPERVKAGIDRDAYNERRQLTQLMREPAAELPPGLQAVFLASLLPEEVARTRDAKPVVRSRVRWLPWLAAAGWLLFLAVSSVLMLRQPDTRVVEKTVFAPAAPPETMTVYLTDTLYQTVIRYRTRTVRDTIFERVPYEQLVLKRDTVYLAEPPVILARGSSSLSGKERVLDFLYSSE